MSPASLILYKLNLNINIRWRKYKVNIRKRTPRHLSNSSLRAISLHENVANIILWSLEEKHSRESQATKRLLVGTSELDRIIRSRVTIHNMELKVRMKKRWTVCYVFLDTSTAIKSAGVLTRQIDFSIPPSARNSLSVVHAKLQTRRTRTIVRSILFSRRYIILFILKIEV